MTIAKSAVTVLAMICAVTAPVFAQGLAQRVKHTKLENLTPGHSHGSVGERVCQQLVSPSDLTLPFGFINRCRMLPGGGVAEHFHNTVEEMFTVLGGESELTVDGRTSVVKGYVGAPSRLGHAHAIYNSTSGQVDYMNINVPLTHGHYDASNLGDSRDKVTMKDAIPQFITMRLEQEQLRPMEHYRAGLGTVRYRRVLDPDVFLTNWAYMDHLVIPAGASEGVHYHMGVEEIYYVIAGEGQVKLNDQTAPIGKWDAVPIRLGESHAFVNNSSADLELMIIGISARKNVLDTEVGARPGRGGRTGN